MEMVEFSIATDAEKESERVTSLKVQRQSLQNIIRARTSRFMSKRKKRKP